MESNSHVSVPLRTGKKMKKRKELDALVANSMTKRSCAPKRATAGGGISSQDQLLSESTDDQEYWVAGATKRPRAKIARRRACETLFRACSAFSMFACVVATTTVLWLFIDVREQITALRSELDQVVASSQGVPDALQKCHTVTKNLQQNQTIILGQISDLKNHMENLSREVSSVQNELNTIQQKLSNAPEYVNIPQQISEISGSVANLGSQIKDLTTTVTTLKDFKNNLQVTTNTLKNNVTDIRESLSRLQNISQVKVVADNKSNVEIDNIIKNVDEIKTNLTNINSTLNSRLQWLIDDQTTDHKTVDLLSETGHNMSARITTLEGICNKLSSDEITLRKDVDNVSKQVTKLATKVQGISTQVPLIQSQYRQLNNSNAALQKQLNSLLLPSSVTDTDLTSPSLHLSTISSVHPHQSDQEQLNKLVTNTPISINPIQSTTQSGKPDVLEIKKDAN